MPYSFCKLATSHALYSVANFLQWHLAHWLPERPHPTLGTLSPLSSFRYSLYYYSILLYYVIIFHYHYIDREAPPFYWNLISSLLLLLLIFVNNIWYNLLSHLIYHNTTDCQRAPPYLFAWMPNLLITNIQALSQNQILRLDCYKILRSVIIPFPTKV